MNLSSQLFDGVVNRRLSAYVASLMRSILPGQTILLASGERCRVTGKTASASGIRLQLAKREGSFSAAKLATLYPVSKAGMRLASFVHVILAADSSLNTYVNAGIEQAGLPKDPSINWDKYLGSLFNNELGYYTKDIDEINDIIRDVVCHELFEKRILETVFNPDHASLQGKELMHKVSAFLVYVFKTAVPRAVIALRRSKGVGMGGRHGLRPAESLTPDPLAHGSHSGDNPSEDFSLRLLQEDGEDSRLALDEVHGFLDAFRERYRSSASLHPGTLAAFDFITDCVEQGMSRSELRAQVSAADFPLVGRDGNPYRPDTWRRTVQAWVQALTAFATSRFNAYADTGISKAIVNRAQETAKAASGLHLAMEDTGQLAQLPYSSSTNAPTVIEPTPPVNPNVAQQQDSIQNKKQQPPPASPQEQQNAQGEGDTQKPAKPITIEIDGAQQ
jgi:hypothetical protein